MKKKTVIFLKKALRPSIFVIVGCFLGFLYYKFFGCTNGCPITSNPTLTIFYGGAFAFLISIITKKEKVD